MKASICGNPPWPGRYCCGNCTARVCCDNEGESLKQGSCNTAVNGNIPSNDNVNGGNSKPIDNSHNILVYTMA